MATITINLEVPVEIDYTAYKSEQMTRDYPGYPGYIDINAISIFDRELSWNLYYEFKAKFEEEILEQIRDELEGG